MPVGEGFATQLEMFAHAVWPLAMTAS
jgi:hypothetical protein